MLKSSDGSLECKLALSAIDRTVKPYDSDYPEKNEESIINFPICNGSFHKVLETLKYQLDFSPTSSETETSTSYSESSGSESESSSRLPKCPTESP